MTCSSNHCYGDWRYGLGLIGAVSVCASGFYLEALFLGTDPGQLGLYVPLQFIAGTLFMLLSWRYSPRQNTYGAHIWTFLASACCLFVLVGVQPYTSNDIDRYLFDGRLLWEGYDPYRVAHDASELVELRAQWQPPDEHAKYATLYPPMAIALFAWAAGFGVDWALWVWKGMSLLAAVASIALMALVLKRADRLYHLPLIALSPLVLLEIGMAAHVDAFCLLFVSIMLWAWQSKRHVVAGAAIGCGLLVKLLPAMLFVPLFFALPTHQYRLHLTLGVLLTLALGYGSAFVFHLVPVGSIGVFFEKWRFGSPVFHGLLQSLDWQSAIYILAALGLAGLMSIAWYLYRRQSNGVTETDLLKAMQWSLTLPLLLSPVLFNWYLLSLLPLIAWLPTRFHLIWVLVLPLTYEVLGGFYCCQDWQPQDWPLWIIGVGALLGFCWDSWAGRCRAAIAR